MYYFTLDDEETRNRVGLSECDLKSARYPTNAYPEMLEAAGIDWCQDGEILVIESAFVEQENGEEIEVHYVVERTPFSSLHDYYDALKAGDKRVKDINIWHNMPEWGPPWRDDEYDNHTFVAEPLLSFDQDFALIGLRLKDNKPDTSEIKLIAR